MPPSDWMLLVTLAMLLLGVPFLLAFPTAFFTPEDGLSCRSLTFVVFASVEYTQIALWLWAYAGPPPATPAQAAVQSPAAPSIYAGPHPDAAKSYNGRPSVICQCSQRMLVLFCSLQVLYLGIFEQSTSRPREGRQRSRSM